MSQPSDESPAEVTVWYDSDCPLCVREISLMRRLDASDWLAYPNLDKVNAAPSFGDRANTFNLTVQIQAPASENKSG